MASHESTQHYVMSLSELRQNGRKNATIKGRKIFLVYVYNRVFALDSLCYHAGGPLHLGDIEDVSGHICIVCPWHKYKIELRSGEGLYHSIDPYDSSKLPELKSKGVKQRCHRVIIQDDAVYVILTNAPELESDHYNVQNESIT